MTFLVTCASRCPILRHCPFFTFPGLSLPTSHACVLSTASSAVRNCSEPFVLPELLAGVFFLLANNALLVVLVQVVLDAGRADECTTRLVKL